MSIKACLDALHERFPDLDFAPAPLQPQRDGLDDDRAIRVAPDRLLEIMRFLHDDPRTDLKLLADLSCVDYLRFPRATDRYGVLYNLLSITHNHRLFVRCFVNDPDPRVPSVTPIWRGAEWLEREVYDMFGVRFDGHPDLRRILTWDGFGAHPLRKDYPLRGRGERENFAVISRESA